MTKTTIRLLGALLLLPALAGCQTPARPGPPPRDPSLGQTPGPDSIVWSNQVSQAISYWRTEAARRWPGRRIVVFACHGGSFPTATGGVDWWAVPDMPRATVPIRVVAQTLHDLYPDAVVLLICCNPGHVPLDVPGVAWARRNVWIYPDSYFAAPPVHVDDDLKNIWEFEYNEVK